jgi:hypothetical protein
MHGNHNEPPSSRKATAGTEQRRNKPKNQDQRKNKPQKSQESCELNYFALSSSNSQLD